MIIKTNILEITHNYYLIVDLEATCSDDKSIPRHKMEIIEIGAVMLNSKTLKIEDEFQTFIQPILNSKLSDFCQNLTSISQSDVDNAPQFPEALKLFKNWFSSFQDILFCSWGGYDKNQFAQDCKLHNIQYPFSSEHLNLKTAFSEAMGTKHKYGMKGALEKLNLALEGVYHRGIDDARNIAKIVISLRENN